MTMKKNNSLSNTQKFQLCVWVRDIAINDKNITCYAEAAAAASSALGFNVTHSNAEYAYSSTETPTPRGRNKHVNSASAHQKARSCARGLSAICRELNFFPDNYAEILKIAEQEQN